MSERDKRERERVAILGVRRKRKKLIREIRELIR